MTVTLYRIRIYRSPDRQLVHTGQFRASGDDRARAKAGTIVRYIRHRKQLSAYVTSWALDALRIEPIRWETVATS